MSAPEGSGACEAPSTRHGFELAPVPPRTLTMKEIRSAIPRHCFERRLLKSLRYLFVDLVVVVALGAAVHALDTSPILAGRAPRLVVNLVVWPFYWWFQGAFMTGIWVLAHECGHQAFSRSKTINDAIGLVLHSALLVPYHSWRITHGQHHAMTNSMSGDQVFVPPTKEDYLEYTGARVNEDGSVVYPSAFAEAFEESPLGNLLQILRMFLLGWPAYLVMNVAGQKYGPGTNHFNPRAKMFKRRDFWNVIISDAGLVVAFGCIGAACRRFGVGSVVYYYGVPYLFVNMWLVLYTYLQHSSPAVPHYADDEWNFIRGALATVDRNYGIYNTIHHEIGSLHVAHHLFSQMPFYNHAEATHYLKKVVGPYYNYDKTPIPVALMRSWTHCKYVDPKDGPVMYFRSLKGDQTKAD